MMNPSRHDPQRPIAEETGEMQRQMRRLDEAPWRAPLGRGSKVVIWTILLTVGAMIAAMAVLAIWGAVSRG